MVERYSIESQNNHVIIKETDRGKGEEGQVKSGESTWLGRKIKIESGDRAVVLNRGSLIEFLNKRSQTQLDKGFFGGLFGGSDEVAIQKVFNEVFAGHRLVIKTKDEVAEEALQDKIDDLEVSKEEQEDKVKKYEDSNEVLLNANQDLLKQIRANKNVLPQYRNRIAQTTQLVNEINYFERSIESNQEKIKINNKSIEESQRSISKLEDEMAVILKEIQALRSKRHKLL